MRDEGCSDWPSRSSAQRGRAMLEYSEAFIGIDAAKSRNAIAIAEAGREGEIRYLGEVEATPQRALLQSWGLAEKALWQGPDQAAIPNRPATKAACARISPPPMFRTGPFLIIAIPS